MRKTPAGVAHTYLTTWQKNPWEEWTTTTENMVRLHNVRPKPTPRKKPQPYTAPTPYFNRGYEPYITAQAYVQGSGGPEWRRWETWGDVYCTDRYNEGYKFLMEQMSPHKLRMKLRNNAKDEILDVAMVLAELQSTATTAGVLIERVLRSLGQVARRRPFDFDYLMHGRKRYTRKGDKVFVGKGRAVGVERFNREVAGTFLEWKYGIMPSVMDLQGSIKALDLNEKGTLFNNPPLLVARATEVEEDSRVIHFGGNSVVGKTTMKVTRGISGRFDYLVTGEGLRGLNRYGIGLGSIATVAWDKTPFSFVVDMAFPVASLIKSWSALTGCEPRGYSETYWSKGEINPFPVQSESSAHPYYGTATVISSLNAFERKVFHTIPMPMPFVQNPVKLGNFQTIAALFTQLRGIKAPTPGAPPRKQT